MVSRKEAQREAGKRYQATIKGRLNHAKRQAAYRRREREKTDESKKVTHHSSLADESNAVNTRTLRDFYHYYQRSNPQQRSKMVNDLDLFFKAQASLSVEKQAQSLQAGPEGEWCSKLQLGPAHK